MNSPAEWTAIPGRLSRTFCGRGSCLKRSGHLLAEIRRGKGEYGLGGAVLGFHRNSGHRLYFFRGAVGDLFSGNRAKQGICMVHLATEQTPHLLFIHLNLSGSM